jgi:hypothetical protein
MGTGTIVVLEDVELSVLLVNSQGGRVGTVILVAVPSPSGNRVVVEDVVLDPGRLTGIGAGVNATPGR